jgi:hypothetical protein
MLPFRSSPSCSRPRWPSGRSGPSLTRSRQPGSRPTRIWQASTLPSSEVNEASCASFTSWRVYRWRRQRRADRRPRHRQNPHRDALWASRRLSITAKRSASSPPSIWSMRWSRKRPQTRRASWPSACCASTSSSSTSWDIYRSARQAGPAVPSAQQTL